MSTTPTRESGTERVQRDLQQVLRTGPFPAALHLAIEASGLTLEQLQVWLAEHGAMVSVPTLSYWRRGRSRPERRSSLRAVHLLEELLRLPPDSLVSLLGPRRPRGRWATHIPGSVETRMLWDQRPVDLINLVSAWPRGTVRRVSTQVSVLVGADRLVSTIQVRELIRANVDHVSRCGIYYLADEEPTQPPALGGVRYCRVGQVQVDRSVGMIGAELVFDRVLRAGEPALLEYEWRFSPGSPMVNYDHRFPEPVHEYVLQVRFDPAAVPAECHRYDRPTANAPEGNCRELWIGSSGTALLAESDVPAGIAGVRWSWPTVNVSP